VVTRFAPSPTGYLHLGHALSARSGFDAARQAGGRFLLRIEDIDRTRCRPELEAALIEDLQFLGLHFDGEIRRQSEHMDVYDAHLSRLSELGLLYPCFCTRAEIAAEIAQAQGAPHDLPSPPTAGGEARRRFPDTAALGAVYPGTCRGRSDSERQARIASGQGYALRLDVRRAREYVRATHGPAQAEGELYFFDRGYGRVRAEPELLGDVVLGRKEVRTSYHLAVTVDDHLQGITLVTRGEDLFHATHIHRLLQAIFGFAPPEYAHHRLLAGPDGERLAKRRGAPTLRSLRQAGKTAAEIWAMAGLPPV
jgi:glutamyl-Q tRNA(Asp) synthetase